MQLPGLQMGDIPNFWPAQTDIKEFGPSMSLVLMGGISFLSQIRPILPFQAEFVPCLIGISCTIEQTANTEHCLVFRETDQEGLESITFVFLPWHSYVGQGSSCFLIHIVPLPLQ